jgi:gas vesicle protein
MNSSKLVVGILGGVAVGALIGILFAPEKGSKTRKKIVNKSSDFVDDVKDKFDDMYADVTDKYENLLSDAKGMIVKKELK